MVFVSIGCACNVRHQIDKYRGKKDYTLFFDWLITDMNSVCKILESYKNIDSIVNKFNIEKSQNKESKQNKARVRFKNLSQCESMHDLPDNFSEKDLNEFVAKYKRRFGRIIDLICQSTLKICFIRCGYVSPIERKRFISVVKQLNSKCNFSLISLIECKENIKQNNYSCINLSFFQLRDEVQDDWTSSHYDWKRIFQHIETL